MSSVRLIHLPWLERCSYCKPNALRELRKKQKLTQTDMAQLLGIKQENVSRLERRNNIHLSTLKDYIHALGGKLHLIVEFPNQEPIEIKDVETIEATEFELLNSC